MIEMILKCFGRHKYPQCNKKPKDFGDRWGTVEELSLAII